jgi:protein-S-isoprenylcysteine O-methyltransferase Ste14
MTTSAGQFIAVCWLTFFIVWIVAAFWTKRTVERAGWWSGWWMWVILAAFVLSRRRAVPFAGGATMWHATETLGIVADVIAGIGLFVALWARASLGTNWSADVVFKERHELIERGPYRFVRHPIYTGVLLMLFGTVILSGRLMGLILLGISIVGLSVKARREERLLTRRFPEAYRRYRAKVKAAIIPFVI